MARTGPPWAAPGGGSGGASSAAGRGHQAAPLGAVSRPLCPGMGPAAQDGTGSTRGAAPSRAQRSQPCSSTLDGTAPLCGDGKQWAAGPRKPTPQRSPGRIQSGPIGRTRTQQNIFYFVALDRGMVYNKPAGGLLLLPRAFGLVFYIVTQSIPNCQCADCCQSAHCVLIMHRWPQTRLSPVRTPRAAHSST